MTPETLEELKRRRALEHSEAMTELKQELDDEIRAAVQPTSVVPIPQPFRINRALVEQQRRLVLNETELRIRRGWSHVIDADQESQRQEGADYWDDAVSAHDEFVAEMNGYRDLALRRIDQAWALVTEFNDVRLDIYNALRSGDVTGAKKTAMIFLARPAIAP